MPLININKRYVAKHTGKRYSTKEEALEDDSLYHNDVNYRYNVKWGNYKSPYVDYTIPFIPEKQITLSNAGLATGAILSTNMLDSIADSAEKERLSLKTALGIATKESTLGNPTFDLADRAKISKSDRAELEHNRAINSNYNSVVQNIGLAKQGITGGALVHYNPSDNPYADAKQYAFKKAKSFEEYYKILEEGEKYADSLAEKNQKKESKSYLRAAFAKYKRNPYKYNPGQPNYPELVEERGAEVWGSPEVQFWYKRRLESAGKKSK